MPSNTKPVIDITNFWVDYPDGEQTVVFFTSAGEEVRFRRDRQGFVVKVTPVEVDGASLAQARIVAGQNLSSPILERSAQHEVKVVPSRYQGRTNTRPVTKTSRPPWLREGAAAPHARSLDPHEVDSDD